jgi:hypothetical protein
MGIKSILPFAQILGQTHDIKAMQDERIEEARVRYWDACKYPRKKKKAMRKIAKFDFHFWSELREMFNDRF